MQMPRKLEHGLHGLSSFALAVLCSLFGQQGASAQTPATGHTMAKEHHGAPTMTDAQRVALAQSAGPAEIAKHATIIDMTDASNPRQLRAGTNGWACYAMIGEPMCLDKTWQNWAQAWMSKGEPKIVAPGVGYMLQGDQGASNTDPYATAATSDNQWVVAPAHIMLLYADPKVLDAYPTDWRGGGPWVMWKGTPYAHVMVPVSPTKAAK
jgi:hypothetical protein